MLAAAAVGLGVAAAGAQAQSKSAPAVAELVRRLEEAKLQYIAAKDPSDPNRFVAAVHFPGIQLMVISARYAAPALLNEKLLGRRYQDAYVDLNSASERDSRVFVEDLLANGLTLTKTKDEPNDAYEEKGKRVVFDFDWRKQKLSEKEYFALLTSADEHYSRMLGLLLAEAKQPR
jgi:hypothetical protein